ncbi:hypothetical protein [Minwuia sp.]|uniref:hypothetical protein n=1 Tax=Minwuia sp. TaxID=2493630 RepID=UPI003A8F6795
MTGRIDPGSAAATRLERLTRPFAARRLAQNNLRGGTNPTTARAATVPASPPARSKPAAKPAPAPKPKAGTPHLHKSLNPTDFDDPAFGGWSHSDAMRRGVTKNASANADAGPRLPEINLEADRKNNILANDAAVFRFWHNPSAQSRAPWWEDQDFGAETVAKHAAKIEEFAEKHRVDPDLVKSIMFMENARGNFANINELVDYLGLSKSKAPMNIKPTPWDELMSDQNADFDDEATNIEAGVILIKRITDRLENPSPAAVASVWNFLGREKTNDIGAYVGRIYAEKPWNRE